MKKNGFTLVEILSVLLILGLIMGIAVPSIFSIARRLNNKGFESKIKIIEDAAIVYAQNNSNKIKKDINDTYGGRCISDAGFCCNGDDCEYVYHITIEKLISEGALKSEANNGEECNILNPSNKDVCLDSHIIEIRLDDNYKTATAKYIS